MGKKKKSKSQPDPRLIRSKGLLKKVMEDDSFVVVPESDLKEPIPHVSSGWPRLDDLIGGNPNRFGVIPCQGIPRARIVQIYSEAGQGRDEFIEAFQKEHPNLVLVDFLGVRGGVDTPESKVTTPQFLADVTKDAPLAIHPDSLACGVKVIWAASKAGKIILAPDFAEVQDEYGDAARVWSQLLPQLQAVLSRTGGILVGVYKIRQGPQAWQFYSAVRILLTRGGDGIYAKIEKCKVAGTQGLRGLVSPVV